MLKVMIKIAADRLTLNNTTLPPTILVFRVYNFYPLMSYVTFKRIFKIENWKYRFSENFFKNNKRVSPRSEKYFNTCNLPHKIVYLLIFVDFSGQNVGVVHFWTEEMTRKFSVLNVLFKFSIVYNEYIIYEANWKMFPQKLQLFVHGLCVPEPQL